MTIHGHNTAITTLLATARGERCHHAWLFTGAVGVGKATAAHTVASRLLAESAGPMPPGEGAVLDPEHRIARLIAADAHSDFIWLTRLVNEKTGVLARNITIDQVRALGPRFALSPSHSQLRIVVIDSVDDLERGAANALLKSLEEPPRHTIFFLISHAPDRLLPTIRSRCRVLRFAPLDDVTMTTLLSAKLPEARADELASLVGAAAGAPGKALALGGLDIAAIDKALLQIAQTGDPANTMRSALASQLALKAAVPRYQAFLNRIPQFIAGQARRRSGPALNTALDTYAQATQLAITAPIHNVDPQSAVFELCSLVAGLAK